MVESLNIWDLDALGVPPGWPWFYIQNGYGFIVKSDGVAKAAFGFVYCDNHLEVWFRCAENINPFILRELARAFHKAVAQIPNNIPIYIHRDETKVAFEPLAIKLGFKILGWVSYAEGKLFTAKRFGGKIGT